MDLTEIINDDLIKLYEDILGHIKYLESNIIEEQVETSDTSE